MVSWLLKMKSTAKWSYTPSAREGRIDQDCYLWNCGISTFQQIRLYAIAIPVKL